MPFSQLHIDLYVLVLSLRANNSPNEHNSSVKGLGFSMIDDYNQK